MTRVLARGAGLACLVASSRRKALICLCGEAANSLPISSAACPWRAVTPWPTVGVGRSVPRAPATHPTGPCNTCQAQHTMKEQRRGVWDLFRRVNFGSYAVLDNVGEVSLPQPVPTHIPRPPYAETGEPLPPPSTPDIHSLSGEEAVRNACRLAAEVQNAVRENIKAGMTTEEVDALVHSRVIAAGAYPSPLNYRGFPKSVCTSVNNVACHGIPDNRPLMDGDIVSVDVTVFIGGYHGDCCETYMIGEVDDPGQHLVRAARRCRDEAIALCGPGVPFYAIGNRVEKVAEEEGVRVVPCFIGHGISNYFHGPPDIYHCYNFYPGEMEPGMTFTVEPVITQGKEEVVLLEDGWTAVMLDNARAAQFEHTILITDSGHEILTKFKGNSEQ